MATRQVFEEAVLVIECIWEVRCRPAIVLREAKIDLSACVDTSVQIRFFQTMIDRAREIDVAKDFECLAMSGILRAVLERT